MSARRMHRAQPREKIDPASLKRLAKDTKKYWPLFIIAALCLLVATVFEVLSPNKLGELSNYLMMSALTPAIIDMDKVLNYVLVLGIYYCVFALLTYFSGFLIATGVQHYGNALRQEIERKINTIPLSYFDSHQTGDIMSRVTNDVDSVTQNLDSALSSIFSSLFLLVGSVIAMFTTSWIMSLITICSIPLLVLFMFFELKLAQPAFYARANKIGDVNGIVEEDYGGQNVIKLFNAEGRRKAIFDKENLSLGFIMFKAQDMGGLMAPTTSLISNLTYAAVLLFGAYFAINGKFGIDMVVITAFLVYIRLFQQPFTSIGQALNSLQTIGAAFGRVARFIGEKELEEETSKPRYLYDPKTGLNKIQGEVVFDHVRFSYDPSREIIHDFSAKVTPGMKVAIVGPTGAGKTTMVNLLERFYEIQGGHIYIDGVDTKKMSREEIHDIFGMVLQDTWVFGGTYRENLVYNTPNVSDEDCYAAIKDAHLVHFTRSLPHQLDTEFGENSQVSAGQKQLITIARAMVRKAPLLILDEATSNVDTRTEEKIQEAMDRLTSGRTSFVIAHRLSTIKNADLILVMRDGNIVEQGTHESLLKQNGFYAGLYNSQFALEGESFE